MQRKPKRQFSEKNYSVIGKISLQKFPIVLQKDKIIKGLKKRYKIKDLFSPDQPKEEIKVIEDYANFNNFKLSSNKNKLNENKKKSNLYTDNNSIKNNPKFFYYNRHQEFPNKFKKIVIESDNFTYAPKYDYIKPRLLTGPGWGYANEKIEKKIFDERDYYIKHEDVLKNKNIKCLVNMNKTTQRIEFVKQKDIKLKNEKKFIKLLKFKKKAKINKNKYNFQEKLPLTSRNNVSSKNKIYKLFNASIKDNDENDAEKCEKFDKKLLNKTKRNNNKKNHSIDFKKIISRNDAEKVKEPKFFKIPFITPNYSLVEERTITSVLYKDNKTKSNNNPKKEIIEGYDYKLKYSPDKYITKINNHLEVRVRNFNNMFEREGKTNNKNKKIILPPYMINIFDRNSVERLTGESLKLNKYTEGKMSNAISSFIPKKSFNRVININLMNSKNFKEKINDNYIEEQKVNLKENIELRNSLNSIKELKNSGLLNHFENFTLKTLDKRELSKDKMMSNNSMKNVLANIF